MDARRSAPPSRTERATGRPGNHLPSRFGSKVGTSAAMIGLTLALVAAVAACGSSSSSTSSTSSTAVESTMSPDTTGTEATTSSVTSPQGSTTTSTAANTTTSSAADAARCHTSELTAALEANQGGAGSIFTPMTLTNTGTRTCNLKGYPGVSLLDASGTTLGSPATRDPGTVASVALAPGAAAHTVIHTQNTVTGTTCGPESTSVRIFPPDELDALTIPGVLRICNGVLGVLPLSAAPP